MWCGGVTRSDVVAAWRRASARTAPKRRSGARSVDSSGRSPSRAVRSPPWRSVGRRSRARAWSGSGRDETCGARRARARGSWRARRVEGSARSRGSRSRRRAWIGCVCVRRVRGARCRSASTVWGEGWCDARRGVVGRTFRARARVVIIVSRRRASRRAWCGRIGAGGRARLRRSTRPSDRCSGDASTFVPEPDAGCGRRPRPR